MNLQLKPNSKTYFCHRFPMNIDLWPSCNPSSYLANWSTACALVKHMQKLTWKVIKLINEIDYKRSIIDNVLSR